MSRKIVLDPSGRPQRGHGARSGSRSAPRSSRQRDTRSVFDSIRRIVRVLRLQARHTEKAFGLSAAQLFVLHKLSESPTLTPGELAEKALTDQSSVSVVVQRLVDRGYVSRARSERDARSFELTLTEAGRLVIQNSPSSTQDRLLAAIQKMSASRVAQLAQLLEELVGHTGLSDDYPAMMMEDDVPPARSGS